MQHPRRVALCLAGCLLVAMPAMLVLHAALPPRTLDAASSPQTSSPSATPSPPLAPTPLPSSHVIADIPSYEQHAPLSCEYAATSAITAHYGNQIAESTFTSDIGTNPNPNKGFRGQIDGAWGGTDDYGVYPGPILDVLKRRGFPNSYRFNGDVAILKDALAHDHPVVAWIVGTYGDASRSEETRDGETFILVPYEHAVTVYGYDDGGVWVLDVGDASKEHVTWETFTHAWMQLDGMALVPLP